MANDPIAPTPKMAVMAERIADQIMGDRNEMWLLGYKATITAIMELTTWKPISEAPKDGTYILAVVAENDSRHL